MRFKLLAITLLVVSIIFIPSSGIIAQTPSDISVSVIPPNPAPFEDVTINLSSYAFNLDSVLITWSLNGKNVSSGIGKKSLFTTVASAGSTTLVLVKIALPSGAIEKTINLRPGVMVMLWQANDSYVPPFYRGKALPTPESEVKVVVIPEIKNSGGGGGDPKKITYSWEKNYTNNKEESGYGQKFFIFMNDYLEDSNTISVTASTVDGQTSTDGNLTIGTTEPEILFYKSDEELGTMWEEALSDPYRIGEEEIIVAIPYFISPKNILNPRLTLNWSINNSPVNILGFRKNIIPVKATPGVSGISKLRLDIGSKDKIFQNVSKEINIEF